MKHLILFVFLSFSLCAFSQSNLKGIWITSKGSTKIEIQQSNKDWVGKIKSSDNPKVELGKVILKDLKKKGNKLYGKLYSPKKKEWYDAEITDKNDFLEFKITVGFFSKTIKWEREKQ